MKFAMERTGIRQVHRHYPATFHTQHRGRLPSYHLATTLHVHVLQESGATVASAPLLGTVIHLSLRGCLSLSRLPVTFQQTKRQDNATISGKSPATSKRRTDTIASRGGRGGSILTQPSPPPLLVAAANTAGPCLQKGISSSWSRSLPLVLRERAGFEGRRHAPAAGLGHRGRR